MMDDAVDEFISITNSDKSTARYYLEANNYDLGVRFHRVTTPLLYL